MVDTSNALAVETAGYAILAMMAQNPEEHTLQARKVVKWLTTKRNGYGGFYSTQVRKLLTHIFVSHKMPLMFILFLATIWK